MFLQLGLDSPNQIDPVGQITFSAHGEFEWVRSLTPSWAFQSALIHRAAGARRLRRSGRRRCRNGRRGRWRRSCRRGDAFTSSPGLLGETGLPAHRNVFVAIGEFGHHRAGDAGFGFRHQAPQFSAAVGEVFPLGLELLAVVEIVFGRIGEGGGHGVAHLGATVQPEAKRQQRGRGGGAQMQPGTGDANDHASFGKATVLRLRKAGGGDRIEALPKHSRSPKE